MCKSYSNATGCSNILLLLLLLLLLFVITDLLPLLLLLSGCVSSTRARLAIGLRAVKSARK
jgi:hypothetical protein